MLLGEMALSRDGKRLALTLAKPGGQPALYIQSLDEPAPRPVPNAENTSFPFWSPDSRFLAFFTADGKLKRVEASGGSLQTICDAERAVGGTWGPDGTIVFAPGPTTNLVRVPAAGGRPVPVSKLDASRHETAHRYPSFLPDGRHFLYTAANLSGPLSDPANAIRIASLDGKEDRALLPVPSNAVVVGTYLFFAREGTLLAQRLNSRYEPQGEAVALGQRPTRTNWLYLSDFAVSDDLFLYAPLFATTSQLVWMDREGKLLKNAGEPAVFFTPHLSPDGKRFAVDIFDSSKSALDVWIYGADGTGASKFAFGPANQGNPVWSPDGKRIAYGSDRKARGGKPDVWVKSVEGGTEEVLFENDDNNIPMDWSHDGRFLAMQTLGAKGQRVFQLQVLDLATRKTTLFPSGGNNGVVEARFSPDGHFLTYDSDESGRYEVYVRAFPGPGGKWQVSAAGGFLPRIRGDGKELYYLSLDNKIMAVPIEESPAFHAGAPVPLFAVHPVTSGNVYDVAPDGKRFLVNTLPADQGSPPLSLLVNWTTLVKP
jgi:Tol biopolymer transport system component